jgi:phosphoribosylformylglycinamidine synthase subunit PurL
LNFGNPYKPEIFWQLREAVEGIAEACRAFNTPVVGGNVSLYNESPAGAVDPTPTVAMVGLIEDEQHITTQYFKRQGDIVILAGELGDELGASHFLKVCHGRKEGRPPRLHIERELALQKAVRELIRNGLVKSAHDCSEGGLAVALAECCFNPANLLGAEIDLGKTNLRFDQLLFSESQSRIVLSVASKDAETTLKILNRSNTAARRIGTVATRELRIRANDREFSWAIPDIYDHWFNSIRQLIESD